MPPPPDDGRPLLKILEMLRAHRDGYISHQELIEAADRLKTQRSAFGLEGMHLWGAVAVLAAGAAVVIAMAYFL